MLFACHMCEVFVEMLAMTKILTACYQSCSYRYFTSKQLVYDKHGDPEKVFVLSYSHPFILILLYELRVLNLD